MAGGQHQAIAWHVDFRPQHAGGIGQRHVLAKVQPLLRLGHGRLIADLRDAFLEQRIHQRRFADVGDAHDHHAQRLGRHAAMRGQTLAQGWDLRDVGRILAGQCDRVHIRLAVVIGDPGLGCGRIGQIALVQQFQAGTLAVQAQLLDHRIAAGLRQARIQHFDHQIGDLHGFRRFLAGGVHVAGEPLYRHAAFWEFVARYGGDAG